MHVRNNGQLAKNSYICLCFFFKLVLEESKTFFSWEKLINLFIELQSLIFFFNLTFYRKKRKSLLTVIQIPKQFFFSSESQVRFAGRCLLEGRCIEHMHTLRGDSCY